MESNSRRRFRNVVALFDKYRLHIKGGFLLFLSLSLFLSSPLPLLSAFSQNATTSMLFSGRRREMRHFSSASHTIWHDSIPLWEGTSYAASFCIRHRELIFRLQHSTRGNSRTSAGISSSNVCGNGRSASGSVASRSTGITVTPGKMVKWEYKLTDTLGDTVHIGASSIAGQRLHASMLVFIPHVCTWRYLLLAWLRYTFLLRACTWEKYSRDNERNVLESVSHLWRRDAVTINQITQSIEVHR